MQPICTHCGRVAADGNLWCHRAECSVSFHSILLQNGEKLGDIEIMDQVGLMASGILYRAHRGEEVVLLKVGHVDPPETSQLATSYAQYIRREAELLRQLSIGTVHHEALPQILPPLTGIDLSNLNQRAYGKIGFRGYILYYIVYAHIEGEMLTASLASNPQPPQDQVAWFLVILGSLLVWVRKQIKDEDYHHTSLNPDVIWVHTDVNGVIRPILFDFGVYRHGRPDRPLYAAWLNCFIPYAYIAPELFDGGIGDECTDVYGLALLAYEMLAGQPPFDYKTRTQALVKDAIQQGQLTTLKRTDLGAGVLNTITFGVNKLPDQRPRSLQSFAKTLAEAYGRVPDDQPKKVNPVVGFWRNQRQVIMLIVLVILIVMIGMGVAAIVGGNQ